MLRLLLCCFEKYMIIKNIDKQEGGRERPWEAD